MLRHGISMTVAKAHCTSSNITDMVRGTLNHVVVTCRRVSSKPLIYCDEVEAKLMHIVSFAVFVQDSCPSVLECSHLGILLQHPQSAGSYVFLRHWQGKLRA